MPGGWQGYIFALVLPTMGFEGCGRTLKLELTCHTGSNLIWNVQDLVDQIMHLTSQNILHLQIYLNKNAIFVQTGIVHMSDRVKLSFPPHNSSVGGDLNINVLLSVH